MQEKPNNEKEIFKSPLEVIKSIKNSIYLGKGIVPLIGSGMSAASGIPAGTDYHAYLFYCLARVFGTDGISDLPKEQWDPSKLRWPEYSEVPVYINLNETISGWSIKINQKINDCTNRNFNEVALQAIGAAVDWRALLNLLSRLSLNNDNKNNTKEVQIKYPDNRVIDSFFVNITKDKRPNSSHVLLAHMSDILRINTILTTNFDNLIEAAFQSLVVPVAVFDVHLDASLPDSDFVRAQRSVVKMHGGRYGLRADFSLDTYPTMDDVEKFVEYLSFHKNKDYPPILKNQRNLLVMGISPYSKRIIALICRAMIKLKKLEIFWICYGYRSQQIVMEEFKKAFIDLYKMGELKISKLDDKINDSISQIEQVNHLFERIQITAVPDLTVFLLELYQNLFLSLPPAGVDFPSTWPFPQKISETGKNAGFNNKSEELKELIINNISDKKIIYIQGRIGVRSLAADVFYNLMNQYKCIWINLDKNFSSIGLTFSIIEAITRKTGTYDIVPAYCDYGRDIITDQIKEQFQRIIKQSKKRFIIFINGREFPKPSNAEEKTNNLINILKNLFTADICSDYIKYVLFSWYNENDKDCFTSFSLDKDIVKKATVASIFKDKAINNNNRDQFYRFVLSLSLVKGTAYITLLNSWSFIKAPNSLKIGKDKDNDKIRFHTASGFCDILRNHNVIRDFDGNFVFIPNEIKIKLLDYIKTTNEHNFHDCINSVLAESHQGIADWYMKLYRASGDIHAVTDSLYHRFECFNAALDITGDNRNQVRFLITSLTEMELAIKLTYNTLYSSFHPLTIIHTLRLVNTLIRICKKKVKNNIKQHEWFDYKLKDIIDQLNKIRQDFQNYIGEINLPKEKIKHLSFSDSVWNVLNINEVEIKNSLIGAIQCIQDRNYKGAEENFTKIYEKLDWPAHFLNDTDNTEKLRENIRKWIDKKLDSLSKKISAKNNNVPVFETVLFQIQDMLKFMIKVFRYNQLLYLYSSQINRYLNKDNKLHLINSEKMYICSTEMMRYVKDNEFLNRENAFLRTNTGIMLSWMKRHNEAYRRYNEAYGYLNFGIRPDTPLEFAIVDLRRGETFLSQIDQKVYENDTELEDTDYKNRLTEPKVPLSLRIYLGILYDAITSIDRGEFRMKGTTVNGWWHCWMLELQLNICNKIVYLRNEIQDKLGYSKDDKYDLFGHCRGCEFCGNKFIKNLEKGLEIAGKDKLRIARYIYFLNEFEKKMRPNLNLNNRFKKARELSNKLLNSSNRPNVDPDVETYVIAQCKK